MTGLAIWLAQGNTSLFPKIRMKSRQLEWHCKNSKQKATFEDVNPKTTNLQLFCRSRVKGKFLASAVTGTVYTHLVSGYRPEFWLNQSLIIFQGIFDSELEVKILTAMCAKVWVLVHI